MKTYSHIAEFQKFLRKQKQNGLKIGFVPTMGALHEGHLQLINTSRQQNDLTVCSIFVNPIQFNSPADLSNYPRDLDSDAAQLIRAGCDVLFTPDAKMMYEKSPVISFDFGYLEKIMEGAFRPGHFKGVGMIVSKLFNIVQPDRAYFGKKDLQQLIIIQTMARELSYNIDIVPVETVRETDGLAMSSRNMLLNKQERADAVDLFKALCMAKEKLKSGADVNAARHEVLEWFEKSSITLEYFEIVDTNSLKNISKIHDLLSVSLCIAGYIGKVRLIDNMSLN